ncbi:Protein HPO-12 a [Aphelenchoides avenae]|nr:Protein HPO-12 a [Aphelenchus avenae]
MRGVQLQEEPIRGDKRGKYTSIVQSIRTVFREEGTGAFWKGHVPAQGLSAVYGLVQFTTFEMLRNKLSRLSEVSPYKKSIDFACGAVAGCTAMTAAMPMDVLRTRLVAQGKHKVYRSATHAIGVIWRTEKVPGFFRGIVPSLAQIAPYTGLQFTCYNFLSRLWTKYVNEQGTPCAWQLCGLMTSNLESSGAFVCGALAGTFAKTLLYPLDLVRHRLQVNANIRRGFGKTSHYKGMIRTILRIARRESFLGLYKGLAPSLIKAAANSGFSFLFYELTCDLIRSLKKAN